MEKQPNILSKKFVDEYLAFASANNLSVERLEPIFWYLRDEFLNDNKKIFSDIQLTAMGLNTNEGPSVEVETNEPKLHFERFSAVEQLFKIHLTCNAINSGNCFILKDSKDSILKKFKGLTSVNFQHATYKNDDAFIAADIQKIQQRRLIVSDELAQIFTKKDGEYFLTGHLLDFNIKIIEECHRNSRHFKEDPLISDTWNYIKNFITKNPPIASKEIN